MVRASPTPLPAAGRAELEAIRAPVADDFRLADELVRRELSSDVELINRLGEYLVAAGGKRLRPLVVLLSARACGATGSRPVELAAIIEFIHTATLLHDDVVDGSELRRGRHTANAVWGNPASVLTGDFLYSRAFQMMVRVDDMRVMRIMADATNRIAEGEVMQLLNVHDPDTTEVRYLEVIRRKTATLFEAGARLGAVVAGRPTEEEQALAAYGLHLGLAFQLIDDVLDYSATAEELGKNIGADLAEGKPTLPLIHALEHGIAAEQELIRDAVRNGVAGKADEIARIVMAGGALDYSRERARNESEQARRALAHLPRSKYADALMALVDFAINRQS
ncbi:MAG TPA: polyprenyl synthetase family protein [Gammaproteobacteria bacterium]|nr:polyprenyl synthetase family protein [Gammaproteobacteria bacterium]